METFSIQITFDDFILDSSNMIDRTMRKLLLLIKSLQTTEQIPATRRYIDLWYKKYGTKNKELIEIYFKSKKNEIR